MRTSARLSTAGVRPFPRLFVKPNQCINECEARPTFFPIGFCGGEAVHARSSDTPHHITPPNPNPLSTMNMFPSTDAHYHRPAAPTPTCDRGARVPEAGSCSSGDDDSADENMYDDDGEYDSELSDSGDDGMPDDDDDSGDDCMSDDDDDSDDDCMSDDDAADSSDSDFVPCDDSGDDSGDDDDAVVVESVWGSRGRGYDDGSGVVLSAAKSEALERRRRERRARARHSRDARALSTTRVQITE